MFAKQTNLMQPEHLRKPIGISIRPDLLEKLDSNRGDVPRSRAIERMLERELGVSRDGNTGNR